MPSLLTRLGQLIPGFTPRPTPPALVVETPEARADRIIAEAKQALDRSRGRPAPSVDEKVPQSYFAGVNGRHWFLPYHHSATADTPEIRAAMRLMIRDAYVKAAWEPLCIAVESEEWQVQPSESGNADAEEQAEFVTANFNDYLKGGVPALVHAIIGQLGPDGFGLAEKVWAVAEKGRLEGKIVLEAAKAKDPDNLHVRGDSFGNVTHVTSTRKAGEEFPITGFLYSRYPGMFDEPLGMAAFRASYGAYWMRDTVRKLRIMHTEKKMAGMLVGTYADGADDDKAKLEAALRAAKSSTWMAIPEGTRVEAVQLSTASEPDYKSHEESLRDEIVTGIAFATLQTMTASVPGEGRGDSEVQKETSELAAWRLMSIVLQVVNEQLIPDLIDYNFPYPAAGGYPKLSFGAISKDEILKDQQVVQAAQQMGLQPSKKHYSKAWSVQLADPNDPDDAMQAGGPPGGGFGGMPGGGDPFGGGGGGDPFGGPPDPFAFSERWESFAWQPAKSRTGGVKAVGTAEDAGRFLYGRQAEAALARQGRTDRGEPHPETPQDKAKRLAQEREPARAEARQAFAKALESPDKITPDELAGLGERMKSLTRDELRGFARNMAARVGGLKPELVERLVAKAREKAVAAPVAQPAAGDPPAAPSLPSVRTMGNGLNVGVGDKASVIHGSQVRGVQIVGVSQDGKRVTVRRLAYTPEQRQRMADTGNPGLYDMVVSPGFVIHPADQPKAILAMQEIERAATGGVSDQHRAGWVVQTDMPKTVTDPQMIRSPAPKPPASATVGKPPEAKPVTANSGNSPPIPSPTVDKTKGIGNTTPVPATPAGGGGKPMNTPKSPKVKSAKLPSYYPQGGWTVTVGDKSYSMVGVKDKAEAEAKALQTWQDSQPEAVAARQADAAADHDRRVSEIAAGGDAWANFHRLRAEAGALPRDQSSRADHPVNQRKNAEFQAALAAAVASPDQIGFDSFPKDLVARLEDAIDASSDPAFEAAVRRGAARIGLNLKRKADGYDDSPPSDWRETMARRAIEDAAKARAARRVEREMGR